MELRSPENRSSLQVENVSPRRGNDIPFRNAPLVLSEKPAGERSRNRYPRPARMKKRMEEAILKRG